MSARHCEPLIEPSLCVVFSPLRAAIMLCLTTPFWLKADSVLRGSQSQCLLPWPFRPDVLVPLHIAWRVALALQTTSPCDPSSGGSGSGLGRAAPCAQAILSPRCAGLGLPSCRHQALSQGRSLRRPLIAQTGLGRRARSLPSARPRGSVLCRGLLPARGKPEKPRRRRQRATTPTP